MPADAICQPSPSQSGAKPLVTIDGPSASGKSSVAKAAAASLGFGYFNSGQLYRFCAYTTSQLRDEASLLAAIQGCGVELSLAKDGGLLWRGEPVPADLERQEVGNRASVIAANPRVRDILLPLQRQLVASCPGGIITDGRDMGTVVFPGAAVKIFLIASATARAERRYRQLDDAGRLPANMSLAQMIAEIKERDHRDESRATAPLKAAADAAVIDATAMSFAEVVAEVVRRAKAKFA